MTQTRPRSSVISKLISKGTKCQFVILDILLIHDAYVYHTISILQFTQDGSMYPISIQIDITLYVIICNYHS